MDSRQHANCCSRLTFWFANPLVQAVRENRGYMHAKMVEDMSSDPDQDAKRLAYFQKKLSENVKQWKMKNNGATPKAEYYQLTRNAIFSTIGCQFLSISLLQFITELTTLVATAMIRNIANYLQKDKEEGDE